MFGCLGVGIPALGPCVRGVPAETACNLFPLLTGNPEDAVDLIEGGRRSACIETAVGVNPGRSVEDLSIFIEGKKTDAE